MEIQVVTRSRKPRVSQKSARGGTKKARAKKPPSLSKLKQETDRLFSLYIRGKHEKKCYTCDQFYPSLQCGHFVSRQYLVTRWDENNCRPQCHTCNIRKHGNILEFEERLIAELGAEHVQKLKDSRKILVKTDRTFYETKIAFYKNLLGDNAQK